MKTTQNITPEQFEASIEKIRKLINDKVTNKFEKKELLNALEYVEDRSENTEWVDHMYGEILSSYVALGKTIQTIDQKLNLFVVVEPNEKTLISFKDNEGKEHRTELTPEEGDYITKFHFIKRWYPSLDKVKDEAKCRRRKAKSK